MSKIAQLKESLKAKKKPDDVIMAFLASTSHDNIVKDPTAIHSAIYKLTDNAKWNKFFESFYFDLSGISPFSDLLDQILSRLETACVLATPNPRYEEYHLKKSYLIKALEKFDSDEKELFHQMANEVEDMLYPQ